MYVNCEKKTKQGTYYYNYLVVTSIAIYLIGYVFFFGCMSSVLDEHSFFLDTAVEIALPWSSM